MMSFRDRIARDNSTLLDPRRFGEVRTIDGSDVLCVFTKDIYRPASGGITIGEYAAPWILHCLVDALPHRPIPQQQMIIDGCLYLVESCEEAMGMLAIQLTVHEV